MLFILQIENLLKLLFALLETAKTYVNKTRLSLGIGSPMDEWISGKGRESIYCKQAAKGPPFLPIFSPKTVHITKLRVVSWRNSFPYPTKNHIMGN
jgi:hypothetical protein